MPPLLLLVPHACSTSAARRGGQPVSRRRYAGVLLEAGRQAGTCHVTCRAPHRTGPPPWGGRAATAWQRPTPAPPPPPWRRPAARWPAPWLDSTARPPLPHWQRCSACTRKLGAGGREPAGCRAQGGKGRRGRRGISRGWAPRLRRERQLGRWLLLHGLASQHTHRSLAAERPSHPAFEGGAAARAQQLPEGLGVEAAQVTVESEAPRAVGDVGGGQPAGLQRGGGQRERLREASWLGGGWDAGGWMEPSRRWCRGPGGGCISADRTRRLTVSRPARSGYSSATTTPARPAVAQPCPPARLPFTAGRHACMQGGGRAAAVLWHAGDPKKGARDPLHLEEAAILGARLQAPHRCRRQLALAALGAPLVLLRLRLACTRRGTAQHMRARGKRVVEGWGC